MADRRLPAASCLRALAACLVLLAGCMGDQRLDNDPLTGGPPIPPAPIPAPGVPAAGAPADGSVPPLPATHSATSPAALAGGGQPAEGGGDPRTVGTPTSASADAWHTSQPGPRAGAVLSQPRMLSDSSSRLAPAAAPSVALAGGPAPETYEQLQDQLAARGVTWQRLETWGEQGEWKFSCSIPNPQKSSVLRHYETRAGGGRGLPAMRAVLAQIDREQR